MADNTQIEWADATVNAINGCTVTSPGCTNCYAMKLAGTRMRNHPTRQGLTVESKAGPVWNGEVRLHEPALLQPLFWTKPRRIFWNAHGDTFHENVPDEWIDRIFAVAALTPQHTHMILTKRSARMRDYMNGFTCDGARRFHVVDAAGKIARGWKENARGVWALECWPLPNVWLGVSVEDQTRADERIPDLLATPAAVRFLSCEPLLGPVDLRWIAEPDDEKDGVIDALLGCNWIDGMGRGETFSPVRPGHEGRTDLTRWVVSGSEDIIANRKLDWVIAGGESGPGARPMHPDWARSLRDQCAAAGVPFHFKQWGNWAPVCEMDEQMLDDIYHPAPKHSPEASRRCKVDQCVLHADGARFNGTQMYEREAFWQGKRAMTMFEVGKKRAGRLLDGVEHNGMPA